MQEPIYTICTVKTKMPIDLERAKTARSKGFTHDDIYMIGLRLVLGDKPLYELENERRSKC